MINQTLKSAVLSASYRMLQPLVRILIRHGISHVEFSELAKRAYVDMCYQHFSLPGRSKSVSRVAVLFGLSRKEVVRLTQALKSDQLCDDDIRRPINRASRTIGGWLQDKNYQDEQGKPLELIINNGSPSFKSLVKTYSGDVTYGAILDELLRIGAVEVIANSKVRLIAKGYVPAKTDLEKINILGTSASDLLTTVEHNITKTQQPRFQREVIYSQLSQAGIDEFRLVSHDKCSDLMLELNDWLAQKKSLEKRLGLTQEHSRVGIGIYYIEDLAQKDPANENNKKTR